MKKSMFCLVSALVVGMMSAHAQLQFNPQIGMNFTRLSENPQVIINDVEVETEGKAGVLFGADLRLGDRIYLQPGLFIMSSRTLYSLGDSLLVDPTEVKRWDGKLKGLVGVKVIDSAFRLRAMAGPTYNFNLSLDAEDHPTFDEDEFKKGYFNIDAGIGVDILFLTAELGYSFALTDVFDNDIFKNTPKYQMLYFTVGLVFGG